MRATVLIFLLTKKIVKKKKIQLAPVCGVKRNVGSVKVRILFLRGG
jgi:hypothetical protein